MPRMAIARAGRALLLLVSFSLVLAVAEGVLRNSASPNDAVVRKGILKYRFNPYQRDRELSYALRPSWETVHSTQDFSVRVRTNELGMRGPSVPTQKDPESLRILVVGDSYAFGFGVEDDESFPARLEQLLGERLKRRVEVLNAGVPGWASDQHLLYLRTRGFQLEPDLVLVEIMQNDVPDLAWHRILFDAAGLPKQIESTRHAIDHHGRLRWLDGDGIGEFPLSQTTWLAEHSHLYHWIRIRLLRWWIQHAEHSTLEERATQTVQARSSAIAELSPSEIQDGLERSEEFRLRYHRHLIEAIESDCAQREIPVRFVLIGHSGTAFQQMREDCAARGDRCLDSTTFFERGTNGLDGETNGRLNFPNDGHWTSLGHDGAARAIADWLLRTQFEAPTQAAAGLD